MIGESGASFHVHHRLATRRAAGNFILFGDAANVHSLADGQRMNLGIHDERPTTPRCLDRSSSSGCEGGGRHD
ncbi:FAD-dependent monooxygenase [Shinella sumterensis]|uniref:FAD-dependent monooxygenase n=1 Tax=Shinella sumterensis TaxID=1967501 RepID=UPI003F83BFF5